MNILLPEWTLQWGVMIAWPDQHTDWTASLADAQSTYTTLAKAILARENLLILCRDKLTQSAITAQLQPSITEQPRLHFHHCHYNDTWARDFGPLTVERDGGKVLLDFIFNGWGNKFSAELDNSISSNINWQMPLEHVSMVLEGGSVESNGNGLLLTTRQCLLNANRNPQLKQFDVEDLLQEHLGAEHILWLDHGHLEGDDTDAHIDTLARFCNEKTIVYIQCTDTSDTHYTALKRMEEELHAHADRHQLTLIPLPMMSAAFDDQGDRLPGSYANFLIINNAVLVPTYQCDTDAPAITQLAHAFPNHDIITVPCLSLLHQHGSLHCVTMQLPEGVL